MPITAITYQPATAQLMAAYRPIVITVQATSTGGGPLPPYVVCDIYCNDVYYKSIIRTAPESKTDTYSLFTFDISTALQEFLQPDLAVITNNNVLQAPHMSAKVYCKFRASGLDEEGFTVEEGVRPVQQTKFTAPIAGDGFLSNILFAINAVLQHEDNQNLAVHLNASKTGVWANNAFPLSHRSRYPFCPGDSDHFPVIFVGDCISTDLKLSYRLRGETVFQQATSIDINICTSINFVVNVPSDNKVDITILDSDIEPGNVLLPGEKVVVQYKKQADAVWLDSGLQFVNGDPSTKTFYVNGDNRIGDYDVRLIRFCTPCLSADPETSTFHIDTEAVVNKAWRGINPRCMNVVLDQTVYVKLEFRNETTEVTYTPNNVTPNHVLTRKRADMYALFFADVSYLTPLVVTESGLQIFIKDRVVYTEQVHPPGYDLKVFESISQFVSDVNASEVFIGNVIIRDDDAAYTPYPTNNSTIRAVHTHTPWSYDNASFQLQGGNDGLSGPADLEEYNTDTNVPTGVTKPNEIGDPDYIAPTPDPVNCAADQPDVTTVVYGPVMKILNFFFFYGGPSQGMAGEAALNTNANQFQYVLPVPRFTPVSVGVMASKNGIAGITGQFYVRIEHADIDGIKTETFKVDQNKMTVLPAIINIVKVTVSIS